MTFLTPHPPSPLRLWSHKQSGVCKTHIIRNNTALHWGPGWDPWQPESFHMLHSVAFTHSSFLTFPCPCFHFKAWNVLHAQAQNPHEGISLSSLLWRWGLVWRACIKKTYQRQDSQKEAASNQSLFQTDNFLDRKLCMLCKSEWWSGFEAMKMEIRKLLSKPPSPCFAI